MTVDHAPDPNVAVIAFYEELYHDLKTPMSILFAYIQMLEKMTGLPAQALAYLDEAKMSCFRMAKLVRDANERAKLERGLMLPQYSNLDMVKLVRGICENAAALTRQKNVRIVVDCPLSEKMMAIDKPFFERILLNLLANAKDYSEPGGLIAVKLWDEPGYMYMVVRDYGPGIPADKAARLFSREPGEGRRGLHSGLGLFIVKELAELMDGAVWLSPACPGTEVTVRLPVFLTDAEDDTLAADDFFYDNMVQMELSY